MKKARIIILTSAILLFSCFNSSKFEINEEVIKEVQNNIVDTISNQNDCSYYFFNNFKTETYLNDTIYEYDSPDSEIKSFRSNWRIENDTLKIFGSNNIADGAFGFKIIISDNEATVFGYARTHIFLNNLAINPTGKTYNSILIPTENHEVIISKYPQKENDLIYGVVNFATKEFYTLKTYENNNPEVEDKIKVSTQIYFKAKNCKEN